MTRGAIKSRVAQLLGLTLGDSVLGDPFALDNAIDRVTDEFAGPGMDCYWNSETSDITAGQAEYVSPQMYRIKGAYWLDSSGDWQALVPTTPQLAQRCRVGHAVL